ncbi:interleukin-17 receptor B isoform X2 [Amblyraja radiata]|uniref:interleukin-17 receptor B isoform X2 n=1 Tax=Amblyraja radiata TaxID=386614 RepID=UPI001401DC10|nr:interleukin-17 receptor B isoform X2 [Amblyraja radiata]
MATAAHRILLYLTNLALAVHSMSVTCIRVRCSTPPSEWYVEHNSTPSDIYEIKAQLHMSEESQLPMLNITWVLNDDGSIQVLEATVICIENILFCLQCNYDESFTSIRNPQNQRWHFHYMDYPVDPNIFYTVSAYSIPTANINEDAPTKSASFVSPGCDDATMRNHKYCEDYLWQSNVSACLANTDVVINFTTNANSLRYDVRLTKCDDYLSAMLNHTKVFQAKVLEKLSWCSSIYGAKEMGNVLDQNPSSDFKIISSIQSNESRISITFMRNTGLNLSEKFCVGIKPYYHHCSNLCTVHEKLLQPCTTVVGMQRTDNEGNGYFLILIGLCAVLFVLACGLFLICKRVMKSRAKSQRARDFNCHMFRKPNSEVLTCSSVTGQADEKKASIAVAEPLQPITVLIIYSADNELFQTVVGAFADFLHSVNGIQVVVDIWQSRSVAEMGPAQWLTVQRDKADKIIIIISSSARERSSYSGDMYSMALNIFCSDLQKYSHLHKYCIVYFDAISSAKDIPSIYCPCLKFCLEKDINKLLRHLHGPSRGTHSKRPTQWPAYTHRVSYNHKMENVILKIKDMQNAQPASNIHG